MKSGEVIKAVKQWFRISNYDVLQKITLNDLNDEIIRRAVLFRYDISNEQSPRYQRYLEEEAKILAGTPLLVSSTKSMPPTSKKKNPLVDATLHVQHMTINDISRYEAKLRDLNLLHRSDASPDAPSTPVSREQGKQRLTDVEMLNPDHPLYLWLNIRLLTDDEVVEHVKRMLPQWRKEYGITEPEIGSFRFGLSTIKKVITFRIIPMLDLMLWVKRHGTKISYEQMSRLLYPNDSEDIRGGSQIKDTDKPFAEKTLTREFERLFNIYLSKNDYMMDVRVADAMKINEKEEEEI